MRCQHVARIIIALYMISLYVYLYRNIHSTFTFDIDNDNVNVNVIVFVGSPFAFDFVVVGCDCVRTRITRVFHAAYLILMLAPCITICISDWIFVYLYYILY